MSLVNDILSSLAERQVLEVRIGTHWTAVVVNTGKGKKCGLASTMWEDHGHRHGPDVPMAGELEGCSGRELASLIKSDRSVETSIGTAAINALLPTHIWEDKERNALEVLAELGKDNQVALVGRFPFREQLRERVGKLVVLEKEPDEGELPESAAQTVFADSQVIAITGMTFINNSLEKLLGYCPDSSSVIVLGPSTPLSPILFDYGVDLLSGSVVENIDAVLRTLAQGANFQQLHKVGIRLVTLRNTDFRFG